MFLLILFLFYFGDGLSLLIIIIIIIIIHRENKTCLFENFRSNVDLHQSNNVRRNALQSNAIKYECKLPLMKESKVPIMKKRMEYD